MVREWEESGIIARFLALAVGCRFNISQTRLFPFPSHTPALFLHRGRGPFHGVGCPVQTPWHLS